AGAELRRARPALPAIVRNEKFAGHRTHEDDVGILGVVGKAANVAALRAKRHPALAGKARQRAQREANHYAKNFPMEIRHALPPSAAERRTQNSLFSKSCLVRVPRGSRWDKLLWELPR